MSTIWNYTSRTHLFQKEKEYWICGFSSSFNPHCFIYFKAIYLHFLHPNLYRKEWLPTPVFLPVEFHGQRSLVGCSQWDRKGSDTIEQLTLHTLSFLKLTFTFIPWPHLAYRAQKSRYLTYQIFSVNKSDPSLAIRKILLLRLLEFNLTRFPNHSLSFLETHLHSKYLLLNFSKYPLFYFPIGQNFIDISSNSLFQHSLNVLCSFLGQC